MSIHTLLFRMLAELNPDAARDGARQARKLYRPAALADEHDREVHPDIGVASGTGSKTVQCLEVSNPGAGPVDGLPHEGGGGGPGSARNVHRRP
ncbi:hypothetical protein ACWGA9_09810 [Streptomyces sp. NPDC054950]